MSLPALARTFRHVETTLRLEQPAPLEDGVVLSFSLAQINGLVKDVIKKLEDIKAAVVSATAAARNARADKPPRKATSDSSDLDESDIVITTDDLIAMMIGLGASLEKVSLEPIIEALTNAAPKFASQSSEEGRYIRRLASRVAESEQRFIVSRIRFMSEVDLLAPHLQERAKTIVDEALTYKQLEAGDFRPVPMQRRPDYSARRRSVSRRFEKTLARLAE